MDVFEDTLYHCGLSEPEAKVYTALLNSGGQTVLQLSAHASLKRTNLYNVLEDLTKKGVVAGKKVRGKTLYFPESPRRLEDLLLVRENSIYTARQTLELVMGILQSKFNLITNKPVITYLEGLPGLKRLYQDILDTGQDILLFRSTFDDKRADVDRLIKKQITDQVKRGIHARVISPFETDAKEMYLKYDKFRLVSQKFTTKFPLNLPAQIIIYGNKISMSTIRKDIIITLIDNKDITETFKVLFEFVWAYLETEHKELVKNWK
ncbi:hypothetical protein A2716_00925 [candidate division WWE3 bacterium RIFCSPHIGHO2_01_FULL_40_23]|uniref:Transcription regulator TrmB N-terminal domain-containing protein n=1 Tax=candidate division WWE3 bacterium RIFCSPLOWO2_01_FULL_41_18 TaxID=1802625 RepID=A0A1F4VEG6_UNCKA|nr:MAG: hypothetical protein A2716_00925 [candidate division WWE3 bacterium RIFCSPHIGHO2_01_FULL_40_23]OGC55554.1 MAG: hypothetical protein A3A78_01195 [candidate division WWE3 bacterium RIFCSPLOWO2_01_FULL_41_18]